MDTLEKWMSFDIYKSENNYLLRTFQKRTRAYSRVWREGFAILLMGSCYLPNSLYCLTSKMQLFHPLQIESTFQAFKVPIQIYKFQRRKTEWRSTYLKGVGIFFWYFLGFFSWTGILHQLFRYYCTKKKSV